MTSRKRRKTLADDDSFKCLDLNPERFIKRKLMNSDAVIEAVEKNPSSAADKFEFTCDYFGREKYEIYPLHHAIKLCSDISVVKALYNNHPPAIKEKCRGREGYDDATVLHLAIQYEAATDVISFLLHMWPEAVREKDDGENTPLHYAAKCAPDDVLKLLLNSWPDAVTAKNEDGDTPLICALFNHNESIDSLSFLIGAVIEKCNYGLTPLHIASITNTSLEVMLFLLKQWPEATSEKTRHGQTPLAVFEEWVKQTSEHEDIEDACPEHNTIRKLLSLVYQLYETNIDNDKAKEIMSFFIELEWWNGVLLLLNQYPALLKSLDIGLTVFPILFSKVGRCCNIKTAWCVISNELDIMEGA